MLDDKYEVDGTEVVYEDEENEIEITYIYQSDGILIEKKIKFEGDTVFKDVLNNTSAISLGIWFIGFLAIACLGIIVVSLKKLRRRGI